MSDLEAAATIWRPWIDAACAATNVDPKSVDVTGIHELTKIVAHEFERPMAPVSSFIWGLALGRAGAHADSAALKAAITETVREHAHNTTTAT